MMPYAGAALPAYGQVREVFEAAERRLACGCSLFDDDDVAVLKVGAMTLVHMSVHHLPVIQSKWLVRSHTCALSAKTCMMCLCVTLYSVYLNHTCRCVQKHTAGRMLYEVA